MTKYIKIEDNDVYIMRLNGILKLACCDCGLVHSHAFMIKESSHYKKAVKQNKIDFLNKNEIGISIKRESRATAQLRRHKYGDLQQNLKEDKYKLIRRR